MRAQVTKNAVIVPAGAKGGFYIKRGDDVERHYVTFIRSLLSVTDNLVDGEVVQPPCVRVARRRRHVPRGRGRQGHGDVLATPPTGSRTSTASGSTTRSPPAARRATTTRRSGSRPRAPGSRSSATSRSSGSTRRPTSSPSSGSATCPATCSATGCCCREQDPARRGLRPPARVHRPRRRTRPSASRSASGCSSCRARRWDDYDRELSSPRAAACTRAPRSRSGCRRRRARRSGIADESLPPTDVIRAILRAPVDLLWNGGIGTRREGLDGDRRRRARPRSRRHPRGRERAAREGRGGGRQPRLHAPRAGRVRGRRRAHQRRLHRQLGRRRLLRPRGQPEDPARPGRARRRADARGARRAAARGHRRRGRARALRLVPAGADHRPGGRPLGARGCSPTRT